MACGVGSTSMFPDFLPVYCICCTLGCAALDLQNLKDKKMTLYSLGVHQSICIYIKYHFDERSCAFPSHTSRFVSSVESLTDVRPSKSVRILAIRQAFKLTPLLKGNVRLYTHWIIACYAQNTPLL